MSTFKLAQLGWKPCFQQQIKAEEKEQCYPARISKIHRSHLIVWSQNGIETFEIGVFSEPKNLAVGDWILIPNEGERPLRVFERETVIIRIGAGNRTDDQLIAANVDTLFIVTSCNQDFNASRIERYIALAHESRIKPVIILTKVDLTDDVDAYKQQALKLQNDIRVECVNAKDKSSMASLKTLCSEGHTIALVGSSGVGKSTLINSLTGAEQLTAEIRDDDNKGKHTTTSRSLHLLDEGGILIDMPGIRELQLSECDTGIEDTFDDITQFLGHCKFNNCQHNTEPGCAIKAALDSNELNLRRWQSYQKLQNEQTLRNTPKYARSSKPAK
ncbi:MAG TPA: ribosome small subunit-dependent GTPase A [Thiotrichaceae bacterium]|jgi:ribosome biogenesis GTPase|nr:ribosome small subunit-dependent GTPase A [Thiotrichaceae bacterium]HIM09139.1 ribosome small subunit-dependent GTPase A [Gammaproteobacteria bacterium]